MQTQQELHILKKHAESLDSRNKKICAENLALRVSVLMKVARTVGGLAGPSPPGEPVAPRRIPNWPMLTFPSCTRPRRRRSAFWNATISNTSNRVLACGTTPGVGSLKPIEILI